MKRFPKSLVIRDSNLYKEIQNISYIRIKLPDRKLKIFAYPEQKCYMIRANGKLRNTVGINTG